MKDIPFHGAFLLSRWTRFYKKKSVPDIVLDCVSIEKRLDIL